MRFTADKLVYIDLNDIIFSNLYIGKDANSGKLLATLRQTKETFKRIVYPGNSMLNLKLRILILMIKFLNSEFMSLYL